MRRQILCLVLLGLFLVGCSLNPVRALAVERKTPTAVVSVSPVAIRTPAPARTAIATPPTLPTATRTATPDPSLWTGTPPVGPVSIPNATVEYYDIQGSTERELRAQLNALGPSDDLGKKRDAVAFWRISWRWPGNADGSCRLAEVTVTHQVRVEFPRWTPPQNASPQLTAKWEKYTRALAEHEKGHADSVVANVPLVADAVKGATCSTANAAAQAALDRIRQQHADYDAATDHGATQGARFP